MARPRVLYVAFDVLPAPNGRAVRAEHTLTALAQIYEVEALTLRGPGLSHIERLGEARLLRTPANGETLAAQVQTFRRAVQRQLAGGDYEAVHCADPFGGAAALAPKIQHGFRMVYEAVGFPSVELRYTTPGVDGDRRFLESLRRDEKACLMAADVVIVGSSVTRAYAQERGAALEKLRVIPSAVDLARFTPRPAPPAPPLRVIYAGSQAPWQGLTSLLFALQRLGPEAPVRAVIASPPLGEWPDHLRRLAKDGKVEERVRFLGPVPHADVPALLQGAHVAVVPLEKSGRNGRQGASPLKLVEAMASGLAVVAADLPMAREIAGDAALFFKPSDEKSLAERLARLAGDAGLRATLGERGRRRASRFDLSLFGAELREAYGPLLGGEPLAEGQTRVTGTPTQPAESATPTIPEAPGGPRLADTDPWGKTGGKTGDT